MEDFCDSGEEIIMSVGSTVTDGSERTISASDKTSSGELSSEFEFIRTMSQSSDGSKVECGKGDLDLSSEWHKRSGSFVGQAPAPPAYGYFYLSLLVFSNPNKLNVFQILLFYIYICVHLFSVKGIQV